MVTYREAGVDIEAGGTLVDKIKKICPHIGGFGGLFPLGNQYLVAGADGVGTKLRLALTLNKHHTVGIDLVAMNVNDILVSGARPLFFLDYFATSRLDVQQAEAVIQGIVRGCEEAGCILLGGETAEMPGFYHGKDYDLAGFAVGIVDKSDLIDGRDIAAGDALIGICSSGLHSNGFSLARKILEMTKTALGQTFQETGRTLGDLLLTPTTIYVDTIFTIKTRYRIKGLAHITGGGLIENTPRMLPEGLGVCFHRGSWPIPAIFSWLQKAGQVSEEEMFRTFNMGIGMVMAMDSAEAKQLSAEREDCHLIGEVVSGEGVLWR